MPKDYVEELKEGAITAVLQVIGECENDPKTRAVLVNRTAWQPLQSTLHDYMFNSMAARLKREKEVLVPPELADKILMLELQLSSHNGTPKHENLTLSDIKSHDHKAMALALVQEIETFLDKALKPAEPSVAERMSQRRDNGGTALPVR